MAAEGTVVVVVLPGVAVAWPNVCVTARHPQMTRIVLRPTARMYEAQRASVIEVEICRHLRAGEHCSAGDNSRRVAKAAKFESQGSRIPLGTKTG